MKMTPANIRKKLAEIDVLKDQLLGNLSSQSTNDKIKALEAAQPMVKPGTPEMETLLGSGYDGMTVEKAKTIIDERKTSPHLWPYEMMDKARAFLQAYSAKSQVISTRQPWRIRSRAL